MNEQHFYPTPITSSNYNDSFVSNTKLLRISIGKIAQHFFFDRIASKIMPILPLYSYNSSFKDRLYSQNCMTCTLSLAQNVQCSKNSMFDKQRGIQSPRFPLNVSKICLLHLSLFLSSLFLSHSISSLSLSYYQHSTLLSLKSRP